MKEVGMDKLNNKWIKEQKQRKIKMEDTKQNTKKYLIVIFLFV